MGFNVFHLIYSMAIMAKRSNRTQIVIDSFLEKLFIEMVKANLLLLLSFPLLFYSSLCSAPPEKRIDPLGALSFPSCFEEGKERRKRRKKIVCGKKGKRGKGRNGRSSTAISPPSSIFRIDFARLDPGGGEEEEEDAIIVISRIGAEKEGQNLTFFGDDRLKVCCVQQFSLSPAEMLGPARFEKS